MVKRCLSIQQPWAWLIANGHKDVENRSWKTKYTGLVLIHAGKAFDLPGYRYVRMYHRDIKMPQPDEFERGGIVGMMDVVDCVDYSASPWYNRGCYGWIVRTAMPLPFRPLKGKLGLFKVTEGEYDALHELRSAVIGDIDAGEAAD